MFVFVRDRGPGFDLDAVPEDRMGVRESIIGRMERNGGAARGCVRRPAAGTEVELEMERVARMTARRRPRLGSTGGPERRVRVVLVDDHRMFRTGVRAEIGRPTRPASRSSARPPTSTRRSR